MTYQAKDFNHLLGLKGFSDTLLKNHFTLYQGYVTNTNKLLDSLKNLLDEGKESTPEYAELKRRFAWEYNGKVLHEYYFENMTKNNNKLDQKSELHAQIIKNFGSYADWEKDFKSTGTMRGIGWVTLVYDKSNKRLFNIWINEHDLGHLAGTIPLLIMDVFEHAYMIDYGLKKLDYISAFFNVIDWEKVINRFKEP